jgi:hypothetical protein
VIKIQGDNAIEVRAINHISMYVGGGRGNREEKVKRPNGEFSFTSR